MNLLHSRLVILLAYSLNNSFLLRVFVCGGIVYCCIEFICFLFFDLIQFGFCRTYLATVHRNLSHPCHTRHPQHPQFDFIVRFVRCWLILRQDRNLYDSSVVFDSSMDYCRPFTLSFIKSHDFNLN